MQGVRGFCNSYQPLRLGPFFAGIAKRLSERRIKGQDALDVQALAQYRESWRAVEDIADREVLRSFGKRKADYWLEWLASIQR